MSQFEVFNDEEQLFRRIDQLRIDDIKDEDITVVSDDKLDNHSIIYYTSVNFKKSHGTLWDRFASKFGDDDAGTRVMDQLNLSGDDKVKYDKALDEGSILLFVRGLSHTEEVEEAHENSADSSTDESREAAEDTISKTGSISDDEEKRSDEMIKEKERETVTKDYDGITVTTEVAQKKEKPVNEIRTDEDTHRIDMSTYVTDYDEELELEEEEVQHAKVDAILEEEEEKEEEVQHAKVDAILEEEEEKEEERNYYHTVKDNVVNMQPEEDEYGIRQG